MDLRDLQRSKDAQNEGPMLAKILRTLPMPSFSFTRKQKHQHKLKDGREGLGFASRLKRVMKARNEILNLRLVV